MIRAIPTMTALAYDNHAKQVVQAPAFKQYGQFAVTVPMDYDGGFKSEFDRVAISHQPSGLAFAELPFRCACKVAAIANSLFEPFANVDEFWLQYPKLPAVIREWVATLRKS